AAAAVGRGLPAQPEVPQEAGGGVRLAQDHSRPSPQPGGRALEDPAVVGTGGGGVQPGPDAGPAGGGLRGAGGPVAGKEPAVPREADPANSTRHRQDRTTDQFCSTLLERTSESRGGCRSCPLSPGSAGERERTIATG